MRALLTPEVVPRLGVVLFKPGKELMRLFRNGRVLIESEPKSMAGLEAGAVPDAHQPLAEDKVLEDFFTSERVIKAAGGLPGLEYWLQHNIRECQYPHSDYHHHELVTMRHPPGAMMLCWYCDTRLREQTTGTLTALARRNVIDWVIDTAITGLQLGRERELSLPELCWWAVYSGAADAITETMAQRGLRLPEEPFQSVYKESDIRPSVPATSILQEKLPSSGAAQACRPNEGAQAQQEQPKVLALAADPESPESFMLKPKRRRWVNQTYTDWVKRQPCECCRRPGDDPHHVIGHGMGGTATKAHDLFVFPLCRECHDELHADVNAFEEKKGSQLQLLFRFLDRAIAIGVIVKA
ncbi:DUF968 domain-containing protein [Klebsiella pneumoniae]|uniref:DUF968 domain-containing protein n=1 Tax=Klebsiella pneumoniae TaxID=573 RepID=UPI000E2B912C|nr:DUF968 domain-containing protein [Klebsiella pneumoniae]SYI32964.1 Protein of uncharacterised function (DUF968) [Klebsiella pneumoniae]HDV0351578.1 DUF968 domain-containing protein [Klebsiella pneumoniae]